MASTTESFQEDAELVLNAPDIWKLRVGQQIVSVSGDVGRDGVDGFIFADRHELLKALRALPSADLKEGEAQTTTPDTAGIPLFRLPARHMETIYRTPEDELYLVRLMIAVER